MAQAGIQMTARGAANNPAPPDDSGSSTSSVAEWSADLRRDLKERHVNMIAFSACVGISFFLTCGKAVFLAGPGLAIVGFLLSGFILWCVAGSLGEMTALFPVKGAVFVFPRRFLDAGVGYAAGWMAWFSWVIVIAAELVAIAQLFKFHFTEDYLDEVGYPAKTLGWSVGETTSPAIWVGVFWAIMLLINCLPVLWFGRLEYLIGVSKMLFIVLLIVFNVVVNILQRVPHDPYGRTWTWNSPYAAATSNLTLKLDSHGHEKVVSGNDGRFLALWTEMVLIVYALQGFEMIAISAPENKDLGITETIKMGTRKIMLRLILLYVLGALTAGFNVPYTDPNLRDLNINSFPSGEHSIFVLAAVRNHVRGWGHFFVAFFIYSSTSAGSNALYFSSRVLHALACTGEAWPDSPVLNSLRSRLQRTHKGVPHNAVFVSWLFGVLGFVATKSKPSVALGRIAINSAVSMLIVYAVICWSYLEFYACIRKTAEGEAPEDVRIPPNQSLRAYDRNRTQYPYKSWGQPLKAYVGLGGCSLLVIFNGWRSFVSPFSGADFVASYISLPIFVVIAMAYHVSYEGWNPRYWERNVNLDLGHPPPILATKTPRKGRLGELEVDSVLSDKNVKAVRSWIWTWLK